MSFSMTGFLLRGHAAVALLLHSFTDPRSALSSGYVLCTVLHVLPEYVQIFSGFSQEQEKQLVKMF